MSQPTSLAKTVKKQKTLSSLKKRGNAFSSPKKTAPAKQKTMTLARPMFSISDNFASQVNHQIHTKALEDENLNTPSLGVSNNKAIEDTHLLGLRGKPLTARKMGLEVDIFLRKNSNFEESKGFYRRPQDYQIQVKEETIIESDEPTVDHDMIVVEDNSLETLITQIGLEETNNK